MDRLMGHLSPRMVFWALVALAAAVWVGHRPAPTPSMKIASVPQAAPKAIARPLADDVAKPNRESAQWIEAHWLPSLVDDTRTILTSFSLDRPSPGQQSSWESQNGASAGPQLLPAGPEASEPSETPAPWYPETKAAPAPTAQAPRLLVVPPEAAVHRSRDLELIAREADLHSRRGFELAARGAYFSARSEFVAALRLVSQALDAEHRTRLHSTALGAGLTALKEAEDFLPSGNQVEADLDLAGIVAGHRTPVLQGNTAVPLMPMTALSSYFTYAQGQLAAAVDQEVAGSVALYGLGKLHKALSERQAATVRVARPKAMVFYQAALLVNPQNHMASNDLGVLLAQAGRYEDARIAVEHSLAIQQSSAAWHNLAVVYQNLGQAEIAHRAERLAQAMCKTEAAQLTRQAPGSLQPFVWVDPSTFAQTAGRQPPAAVPERGPHATPSVSDAQPARADVARFPESTPRNDQYPRW